MSDATFTVERAIDETVGAVEAAEALAPHVVNLANTANVAALVKKSATKATPKAVKKTSPVASATRPAAKRSYKSRAIKVVAPAATAVDRVVRKAKATAVRRKYVRKASVAASSVAAPQIKGNKTMSFEMPNMFAGFTSLPGADKFQAMFGDVSAKSQDAVKRTQAFAEQMTDTARANVEAMVESTRIATAGARDLGQELLASSRTGVEQASTSVKSLVEAKSPTEFFQLHTELTKSSFDRMVAEGSKFTEHLVKLAGETMQPLSNRASVNAEKLAELSA